MAVPVPTALNIDFRRKLKQTQQMEPKMSRTILPLTREASREALLSQLIGRISITLLRVFQSSTEVTESIKMSDHFTFKCSEQKPPC